MKEQLQTLLTKEMDRKNFLQYSGGLVLAAIGVTGFVRVLLGEAHSMSHTKQQSSGYGSSSYGE